MATKETEKGTLESAEDAADASVVSSPGAEGTAMAEGAEEGAAPTQLGSRKYVHAAFFVGGILIAYLSSKVLWGIWNSLAEWPAAVRAVPALLRYAEEDRQTIMTIVGALIGLITVVQIYRRDKVRGYADEVAGELSKVTWPNKEAVTNGTIVVVVASMIATVYVALLDRLWGFVTGLVYGA